MLPSEFNNEPICRLGGKSYREGAIVIRFKCCELETHVLRYGLTEVIGFEGTRHVSSLVAQKYLERIALRVSNNDNVPNRRRARRR